MRLSAQQLRFFAWSLSAVTVSLAVLRWGQLYGWEIRSSYQVFPLFGLLAFSLMWGHYIVLAARLYSGLDKSETARYFEVTSFIVLVAILLHPGLLGWQLWQAGAGLPPGSELNYVRPALRWVVLLGMTAWLVFLAFELRRWLRDKSWWKYVRYANDIAMLAIFYHGLRLGSHLGPGWFRNLWYFYGVSLVAALIYAYMYRPKNVRA